MLNGIECKVAAVSGCRSSTPCKGRPASHSAIHLNFTSSEISAWLAGDGIFQQNKQWVLTHYNYYLFLHNDTTFPEGTFLHPNEIISINGW